MKKTWISFFILVCTTLYSQEIPYGQDFQVNSNTWYSQESPIIAALSNGGFIVCWSSNQQNGSGYDIYCQLFNNTGIKQNGEFRVTSYNQDYWQANISVAELSGGGIIICWDRKLDIFGQMLNASGSKIGGEFLVNTNTQGIQHHPKITTLSDGGFVVYWTISDYALNISKVYGQKFNASGIKIGEEFQENTYSKLGLSNPSVASLRDGRFIVCWTSDWDVYGQIYNASWLKQGNEFLVSAFSQGLQHSPVISVLSNDNFIVCWCYPGPDGSNSNIFGQRFNAMGEKLDGEFQVNTYTKHDQDSPNMTTLSNGDFVVCWQSWGQDGWGNGIDAKMYPEFQQNFQQNHFNLITPLNDASIKTTNPILSWNQPSDQLLCYQWVLHYKVFIDVNSDFNSSLIIEQDQDTTVTLPDLQSGKTYFWKVSATNTIGDSLWSSNTNGFFVLQDATSSLKAEQAVKPKEFTLHQNYPNPFNPETSIRFDLSSSGFVTISVYDVNGRLIHVQVNESRTAGSYSVKWDGMDSAGNSVPSGIYVCRLEVRSADGRRFVQSVKMGLVR